MQSIKTNLIHNIFQHFLNCLRPEISLEFSFSFQAVLKFWITRLTYFTLIDIFPTLHNLDWWYWNNYSYKIYSPYEFWVPFHKTIVIIFQILLMVSGMIMKHSKLEVLCALFFILSFVSCNPQRQGKGLGDMMENIWGGFSDQLDEFQVTSFS